MTQGRVLSGAGAASAPIPPPVVLVVDDDPGTLETVGALLRNMGVHVHTAATRIAAVELGRARCLDLALVDWRLPDGTGFDVVRAWHNDRLSIPWILMSGFLDFDVAAEAGRLGALRAVQSCFDVEQVVTRAFAESRRERGRGWPTRPLRPRLPEPQSSAERWAWHVLRACDAEHDLRTIPDWAAFVGVSGSTLEAVCLTIRIPPRAARDFMRVLRALVHGVGKIEHIEAALQIGEPRTRDALLERAGLLGRDSASPIALETFLQIQAFVPSDHPALMAIRSTLAFV